MGTLSFHIISILKLNFKFIKKDADLHTLMRIFRAIKWYQRSLSNECLEQESVCLIRTMHAN